MKLQVETFVGEHGAELLRSFRLGERSLQVTENIDQWQGEGYRYFKIRAEDGNLYILRFDDVRDLWDLTMFQTRPAGRLSKVFHRKT